MNIIKLLTDNLLNSMNDYVSVLDNECNFIQVNHKQMNIMGYQSNVEILGKSYHQFKGISTCVAETFIDEDLMCYEQLWAAAGTPNAVFSLYSKDLMRVTDGEIIAIK